MLRTHRAGKGLVGCGGWGLGSRNRRGPDVSPTLVSEGGGPHLGAQQASWARVGGANALHSSPAPPVPQGPSHLPLLFSPQPPYDPKTNASGGSGDLGGQGTGLGAQQAPRARMDGANALRFSPTLPEGPLLPASPDLPGLRGTDPVWSPLLLPPLSPHILPVHLGVPPISLGIRVPHQQPAGTLVVGRG